MHHTEVINMIAKQINATSYLEIGLFDGVNFNAIDVRHKVSVDPDAKCRATYIMPSDAFFSIHGQKERFDLIFIDGLHTGAQLMRDIYHALSCLTPNGVIVCHDTMPPTWRAASEHQIDNFWCGSCWRAIAALRTNPNFCSMRDVFTLNDDVGVTVICEGHMAVSRFDPQQMIAWNFEDSLPYRDELMRVLAEDHFIKRVASLPAVGTWEE